MKRHLILLFVGITIFCPLAAQTLTPSITVQAERLDPGYQADLNNLQNDILQYMSEYDYTDNVYNTTIPVVYQIYLEQARETGTQTTFNAQLLVTNGSDQRYFDDSWEFPYNSGQIFQHGIYNAITAVIDFYAYLVLAGEVDKYGKLAGTTYYNTAQEITNRAGGLGRGWSDRIQRLDDLENHRDLRLLKYTFFDAYWDYQEANYSDARIGFQSAIDLIQKILDRNRDDKYTMIYLDGQARVIAQLAADLEIYTALETMIALNPSNEAVYQEFLP